MSDLVGNSEDRFSHAAAHIWHRGFDLRQIKDVTSPQSS